MIGLIILIIILIGALHLVENEITLVIICVIFILGYISGSLLVENKYNVKIESYDLVEFKDSTLLHIVDNCNYNLYNVNYKNKYFHKDIKDYNFNIDVYYSKNNKLVYEKKYLKQEIDNIFTWDFRGEENLKFELSKDKILNIDAKPYIYEMHISTYNDKVRNSQEKEDFSPRNFDKEDVSLKINNKFYTPFKVSNYILYFAIPFCEESRYRKFFYYKNEYRGEL